MMTTLVIRVCVLFITINYIGINVCALPPKARILVQYPLSESDNSSAIEVLNDVGNTETVLSAQIMAGNIYLECVASYPIEWIYEGHGFPDLLTFVETRRGFENFSDPSTYTFSARLDLLAPKETTTGLYSCRKLGTPQVQTFFRIYVPGKNVFLSPSSKKAFVGINDSIATLPCVVTNPNTKVNLFRVSKSSGSLDPINDVPFEPSIGFMLNITEDSYWDALGPYICMAVKEKKVLKILLEAPKAEIVRVTPAGRHVAQKLEKVNETQVFQCEGRENVTILYTGDSGEIPPHIARLTHNEYPDNNTNFPFVATLEVLERSYDGFPGNFTVINCVTVKDRKILHSWEYSLYGEDTLTFSYDSTHNAFLCCTSSFHRPEISRVSCSSPMECQMKKHFCVQNKERCSQNQQYYVDGIPDNCVAYPEPEDHKHDGMFQCFVGETVKEYYFAWGKERRGEPILSFDQIVSNEEIIDIRTNYTGDIVVGEEVEISCHPSPFFFSKEPIWAFERFDGSVEIVDKTLLRDDLYFEKRVTVPKRRRTVKFSDKGIRAIFCFAPSWYSAKEWRNASIPVSVVDGIEMQETTILPLMLDEPEGV